MRRGRIARLWLGMGLHGRLLLPILLVILTIASLRTYFLVGEEKAEALAGYKEEFRELQRYLTPVLVEQSVIGDYAAIKQILAVQVKERANMESIHWRHNANVLSVRDALATNLDAPAWFVRLAGIKPLESSQPITWGGVEYGTLTLVTTPVPALNKAWKHFSDQVKVILIVVLAVTALVSLILRGNLAVLRQLSEAADRFRRGERGLRVAVHGAHEVRMVANAFNEMSEEVTSLLQAKQESHQALQEQLHFSQQLLAVLPIPIFFKGLDGRYLGVNEAWEKLFGVRSQEVLGKNALEVYSHVPEVGQRHQAMDAELWLRRDKQIYEIAIPTAGGERRDAIYYKATFTNVSGSLAGMIGAIVDITERKQAEARLFAEKERAEVTLSSIGDAVITTDLAGRVEAINPVAQHLTGWTTEEAQGKPLEEVLPLISEVTRQPVDSLARQAIVEGKAVDATNVLLVARNGKEFAIEDSAAPIRDGEGKVVGCVLVFHDVSEKRQLLQQITWQAGHDTLTELPNRVLLADRLKRALANSLRQNKLLAVCLLDLDGFKPINDKHGHELGDRLLIEVAGRLTRGVRGGDTVARLGGDEFVLLIGDLNDMDDLEPALHRILSAVAEPYLLNGASMTISASIGVALYPLDDADPDTLLRHADQGMYQAKQAGRNRFQMFDAAQDLQQQSYNQQLDRIRRALQHGELRLYYQPKVNMRSGQVIGMEALLRWQHPERGLVGPLEFLPLAEQTDLIADIGEWVLHEALDQMHSWAAMGENWPVSVNIAARHFQRADFVGRLKEILSRHPDVGPHMLELEILESAALGDIQHVHSVIAACQGLGVVFALDDFGTGYSSLTYLKRLPANILKIDQSFVRDMLDDQEDLALVEAVISLASVFNRDVIAEGVETPEHGVLLMRLGCDAAQGYGIARPMPADEVPAWVKRFTPHPSWALWADTQWELANFPLLVAEYDHLKWVRQVQLAVNDVPLELTREEMEDQHQCRFGRWYDGHGKEHYGHLPEFAGLGEIHTQLHHVGPEIIRLFNSGEIEAARSLCPMMLALKDQILEKLAVLQMSVAKLSSSRHLF